MAGSSLVNLINIKTCRQRKGILNKILKTLRYGWEFLTHPYKTTDELLKEKGSLYSWIFLVLSLFLWTFATGYQNIIVGETSRARDIKLGITFGPDIIITLLTIPIGIFTVVAISFILSKILNWFGAKVKFTGLFKILSFTLNIGSTFFDLQYEIGATLTGHAWQLHEVPNFFYYTIFIMLAPILWSLIITILAVSHYSKLSILKTIIVFLIGILPIFSLMIFIMM
ncbi:MAG: hypothetical protein JEY91_13350 [Spirochaetaceae bacterium]|nr:hypothetical protein [Spirochaetaceae bacterium]